MGLAAFCLLAATAPALATQCPAQPYPVDYTQSAGVELREPSNVGEAKRLALNYKCFGQYDKDVAAVIERAKQYIETYLTLVTDKDKKLALVLDIDETVLSNWPAILADDFGYIPDGSCQLTGDVACGWLQWQADGKAEAIDSTLALFNFAKSRGVKVFFITGRYDEGTARAGTEKNLRDVGYDGWVKVAMRIRESCPCKTVTDFKTAERAKIEQDGYTIIANIGDQMSDLNGGHAQMIFKLPNPFYFVP